MMLRLQQAIVLIIVCSHAHNCSAFSSNGCFASKASELTTYANIESEEPTKPRHIPRRAMPHIQTSSTAEAATKAGYIIRSRDGFGVTDGGDRRGTRANRRSAERRPLRTIRRIVHRSKRKNVQTSITNLEGKLRESFGAVDSEEKKNCKQIQVTNKAQRVTFKATRESSHSLSRLSSIQRATLNEYMTQPVEDYSLLSFHDYDEEEPSLSGANQKQVTSRRWFVRRLTHEEASRYILDPTSSDDKNYSSSTVKESNLFRLAVPLQGLIGWNLTPVIDLEVIPPEAADENSCLDHVEQNSRSPDEERRDKQVDRPKWRGLRTVRNCAAQAVDGVRRPGDSSARPTVKIRSMSVSLLSTQEEVRKVMSKPPRNKNRGMITRISNITDKDKSMQVEAIGMVGKVEEWLKPHITFEAEIAWQDGASTSTSSVVTVKSSAVTSLTIPNISNDILRATVPSAFLVKRLGATLTSKALEICLPRFLRQLERDYYRWSGIE